MTFEWCSRCTDTDPAQYHSLCARKFRTIFDVDHECDCPYGHLQDDE